MDLCPKLDLTTDAEYAAELVNISVCNFVNVQQCSLLHAYAIPAYSDIFMAALCNRAGHYIFAL